MSPSETVPTQFRMDTDPNALFGTDAMLNITTVWYQLMCLGHDVLRLRSKEVSPLAVHHERS